jgi:hypothetical protein
MRIVKVVVAITTNVTKGLFEITG